MNANYQCLFEIKEGDDGNSTDIVLNDFANCILAPDTFKDIKIDNVKLSGNFLGGEYYLISEFEWGQYFAKFN